MISSQRITTRAIRNNIHYLIISLKYLYLSAFSYGSHYYKITDTYVYCHLPTLGTYLSQLHNYPQEVYLPTGIGGLETKAMKRLVIIPSLQIFYLTKIIWNVADILIAQQVSASANTRIFYLAFIQTIFPSNFGLQYLLYNSS